MKKSLYVVLVLILMLTSVASADVTPVQAVDACEKLVFDTDNVKLSVQALLTFDGDVFKKIDAEQIQSGQDFLRTIHVSTPIESGEIKSGYSFIISNGQKTSYDFYTGEFDSLAIDLDRLHTGIIRKTPEITNQVGLIKSIVELIGPILPQGCITSKGNTLSVRLSGDIPSVMDRIATMLLLDVASKRYAIEHHYTTPTNLNLYMFTSTAAGICYCTKQVKMESIGLAVGVDENGRIKTANGSAKMTLVEHSGTTHILQVKLDLEASEYGVAVLPENFLPYNTDMANTIQLMKQALENDAGYTTGEVNAFEFEFDGTSLTAYEATHPEWKYKWMRGLESPFVDGYNGLYEERILRDLLRKIEREGILLKTNQESAERLIQMMRGYNLWVGKNLLDAANGLSEVNPKLMINTLFEGAYGPEEGWNRALLQWRDETLAQWEK